MSPTNHAEADGSTLSDPDCGSGAHSGQATAGLDLTGSEAIGSVLGIRSVQSAEDVLQRWRTRFSTRERRLLVDYGQGTEPDVDDHFPEIKLAAHLGDLDGPLLRPTKAFFLHGVKKKTLYQNRMKVMNRRGLSNSGGSCMRPLL